MSSKWARPDARHSRRERVLAGPVVLVLVVLSAGVAARARGQEAAAAPADLRLEWLENGAHLRDAAPLRGEVGETKRVSYLLSNVGGDDTFAAILSVRTTLGPQGRPRRLEPGPEAGEAWRQELALPLAAGLREVCIEVRLQTLQASDAPDPNTEDNSLCRRVLVETGESRGSQPVIPGVPLAKVRGAR